MTPPDPELEPELEALVLRPAEAADAEAVADVHVRSRRGASMPPSVHSEPAVRAFVARRLALDEVWVATVDDVVVGYLRMTPTWVDDLYVLPEHARQGIGSALLDLAKSRRPAGFGLWVFESNLPARGFYARHGLVELRHTDGSENEEHEPDVELAWRP